MRMEEKRLEWDKWVGNQTIDEFLRISGQQGCSTIKECVESYVRDLPDAIGDSAAEVPEDLGEILLDVIRDEARADCAVAFARGRLSGEIVTVGHLGGWVFSMSATIPRDELDATEAEDPDREDVEKPFDAENRSHGWEILSEAAMLQLLDEIDPEGGVEAPDEDAERQWRDDHEAIDIGPAPWKNEF